MKAIVHNALDLKVFNAKLGSQLKDVEIITASLNVANIALKAGYSKINFVNHSKRNDENTREGIHHEAERLARTLDAEFGFIASKALNLKFLATGWMYLNIYCTIYSALRLRAFSREVSGKLNGENVLVHIPDNNPYFYFDSDLHKNIVCSELAKSNHVIKLKTSNLIQSFNPIFQYDLNQHDFNEIGHFPTIFYEQSKLKQIISKSSGMLQLPSQFWNVDIGGKSAQVELGSKIKKPSAEDNSLGGVDEIINKVYSFFSLPYDSLESKTTYYLNHLSSQINLFAQLDATQRNRKVQRICVSDHDTSIHGPLLSFARAHDIPVEIFAHSHTPTGPLSDTNKTFRHNLLRPTNTCISISGQIQNPKDLTHDKIKSLFNKKIVILLNAFEDFAGIVTENYIEMQLLLNSFIEELKKNGYAVFIRFKPHFEYNPIIKINADEANGPLEQWIESGTIAISFGQATTALSKFAQQGNSTYHIQTEVMVETEMAMINPSTVIYSGAPWAQSLKSIISTLTK